MAEQSYANHRRYVPGFHFVTFGILTVHFLWSLYRLFRPWATDMPVADRVMGVLLAGALLALALYARLFALKVQDRVIRNEMLARLETVLPAIPPDLRPRIGELRWGQLVALRFAGDEELAELTRQVLEGRLTKGDEIKRAVRSWRADHLRA